MGTMGNCTIRRLPGDEWEYVLTIEQAGGPTIELRAGVEDLDRLSAAIDEQLDLMVTAAAQLGG